MKNLELILFVALMSLASCTTSAQSEKTSTSEQTISTSVKQEGMVNLEVVEFKKKMNQKDVVILDVRTPEEIAQGKIFNAIEMDVTHASFKEKIQDLDKSKTYLVYCRSGHRSVAACEIMEKEGFRKLNNLLGGFNAWKTTTK